MHKDILMTHTGALFYLTTGTTLHSVRSKLWLAVQCSLLFQFGMRDSPHILVQYLAVTITQLLTTFKKVLKMFSFGLQIGIMSDITYLSFFIS